MSHEREQPGFLWFVGAVTLVVALMSLTALLMPLIWLEDAIRWMVRRMR